MDGFDRHGKKDPNHQGLTGRTIFFLFNDEVSERFPLSLPPSRLGIEQYFGLSPHVSRDQFVTSSRTELDRQASLSSPQNDVTNSLSEQYPKIAAALNSLRHQPKVMESSTTTTIGTTSLDLPNGSFSVENIVEKEIVHRSSTVQGVENESTVDRPARRRHERHDPSARSPSTDNESDRTRKKSAATKGKSNANRTESTPRQQPTTTM